MKHCLIASHFIDIHVNDPGIRHTLLSQIAMKQIQQGRFSAAANTSDDLHQIYIFILNQLIQILEAVNQFSHNAAPDFIASIIPKSLKKSIIFEMEVRNSSKYIVFDFCRQTSTRAPSEKQQIPYVLFHFEAICDFS